MDDDTLGGVRDALQRYRSTVESSNFRSLRILVEGMMSQPCGKIQPKWADELRLKAFTTYLGVHMRSIASSPEDLLSEEVRPLLVTRCAFDGVEHTRDDPERRERWFEIIRNRISERGINTNAFPPLEPQYLSDTVSGVCGPGWFSWRVLTQLALLDMFLDDEQTILTKSRVHVRTDENDELGVWEDWDIAVAVKIGEGPRGWGGSFALYCRESSDKAWSWRYGVHDEDWRSDIYDTLGAYLDFYAHFREPSEEDARAAVRPLMTLT
jgi:hypothetical protein